MKIVFIGQKGVPAQWGGVEQHVHQLTMRLSSAGHDVVAYARPHYVDSDSQRVFERQTGVRVVSLRSFATKHLDTIVHTFLAVSHAVVKERPDIYHFHSVGPSLLSWMPRVFHPSARVVTTFHSPDRLHQKWNAFARFVLKCGEWTALRFAHRTITVSRDLQRYAGDTYNADAVYIPNGVPTPATPAASMIEAEFDLEPNEYLLVVSRLVRHKGIHYLIDAFKRLDTTKKLVIAGDTAHTDDYVAELKQLASGDDRIVFTGYQTGRMLQELFTHCYAYVQPSESEGLSIAVLEAASYGAGILASDIAPNKEVVEHRGFLFQNKNVDDLAKKLQYMLARPELVRESGAELREFVGEFYNWERVTTAIISLYAETLSMHTELSKQRVLAK